jgi:hypothetical protein
MRCDVGGRASTRPARAAAQNPLQPLPIGRDAYLGTYVQLQLVRIYMLVGEPENALDQLEPLLRVPFYPSPAWLRLDPRLSFISG